MVFIIIVTIGEKWNVVAVMCPTLFAAGCTAFFNCISQDRDCSDHVHGETSDRGAFIAVHCSELLGVAFGMYVYIYMNGFVVLVGYLGEVLMCAWPCYRLCWVRGVRDDGSVTGVMERH